MCACYDGDDDDDDDAGEGAGAGAESHDGGGGGDHGEYYCSDYDDADDDDDESPASSVSSPSSSSGAVVLGFLVSGSLSSQVRLRFLPLVEPGHNLCCYSYNPTSKPAARTSTWTPALESHTLDPKPQPQRPCGSAFPAPPRHSFALWPPGPKPAGALQQAFLGLDGFR